MKVLLITVWICVIVVVVAGIVTGAPSNKRSFRRSNNMLRSRRAPWYRSNDMDNDWVARGCSRWDSLIRSITGFFGLTANGDLCLKIQGDVKILTWCKRDHDYRDNTTKFLYFGATVIDSHESIISPCQIYYVTITASYWEYLEPKTCYFLLIDGFLMCVDEEEVLPDYQLLALYPLILYAPEISYSICSIKMKSICPAPAKVPSIVEPAEETFLRLGLSSNG